MTFALELAAAVCWVVFVLSVVRHLRGGRRERASTADFAAALGGIGRASWASRGAARDARDAPSTSGEQPTGATVPAVRDATGGAHVRVPGEDRAA